MLFMDTATTSQWTLPSSYQHGLSLRLMVFHRPEEKLGTNTIGVALHATTQYYRFIKPTLIRDVASIKRRSG